MPPMVLAIMVLYVSLSDQLCNADTPNVVIPAVFAFGDSILDTGNNNYIKTLIKSNYPPYGQDFPGREYTGRFCNGKVPSDLVVEALGIKEMLPAYLDPNLRPEDLPTGVCFASSGTGYDPLTSDVLSVIPVAAQLDLFKEYKSKLEAVVGPERAANIISNGLYLVSSGNNDITITYYLLRLRAKLGFDAYSDLLVDHASNFIKNLYALGARKITVLSVHPSGCLPFVRALNLQSCYEPENKDTELFNSKLSSTLELLNRELPDAALAFVDSYNILLDFIQYPAKSGFEVPGTGCCLVQPLGIGFFCVPDSSACPNVSKYVFWDGVHPTERAYRSIATEIIKKSIG